MIGNSRLHWAWFQGDDFVMQWHTPHLTDAQVQQLIRQNFAVSAWNAVSASAIPQFSNSPSSNPLPLWMATVVPEQGSLWQSYPSLQPIQAHDLPIAGLYPTLGCDRILALWGAGHRWGYPVLVVDGGTALTFTAATPDQQFFGGAIAPGIRLQFQALAQTANLPLLVPHQAEVIHLPDFWTHDTTTAMQSGVLHMVLAGIQAYLQDWWQRYPWGTVVFTGGDGDWLHRQLRSRGFTQGQPLHHDSQLIFRGIQAYRLRVLNQ
jgi:type III pantothenate kinase